MQPIGNHKDHLAWVNRVLENQESKCMFAINSALKIAEERNLPIWREMQREANADKP